MSYAAESCGKAYKIGHQVETKKGFLDIFYFCCGRICRNSRGHIYNRNTACSDGAVQEALSMALLRNN